MIKGLFDLHVKEETLYFIINLKPSSIKVYTIQVTDKIFIIRFCILGLLVLLIVSLGFLYWQSNATASSNNELLKVTFLDVGQGDAIFIETPDGMQILIDGGPDSSVLRELAKQMPVGDRDLDMILATHPDKDHIGGLVDVLERYDVENIVMTNNKNDTPVFEAFTKAVEEEHGNVHYAYTGQQLGLGASTSILILSPSGEVENWESNTSSIITQLRFGDTEFMLTGDAPSSIEDYLVNYFGEEVLESEVLKLGHHGSKTSTSEKWLQTVQPKYAIVSAGKDNTYGHPNPEVIERASKYNIEILNTAEKGSITFLSDGREVWVE